MSEFTVNILLRARDEATQVVNSFASKAGNALSSLTGSTGRGGFFAASNLANAASGVQRLTSMAKNAIGAPIVLAANFESALNRVNAFSGGTLGLEGSLHSIETRARELGSSTEFTATQVVDAFAVMTQAGFTYDQQMASVAAQVDFATAGQVEMAKGTEVLGTVLGAFGKDAGEAEDVANILAKTSTKTGSNIVMMGQSMKDVGPAAKLLGLDVRQTAAMVGVLGKSFINGGRAGKALKSILVDISPTKRVGRKLLRQLGIQQKDMKAALLSGQADAPFKLLAESFDKKGLDGSQQLKSLSLLFGKRRAAEVSLLIDATKGKGEGTFAFFNEQLRDTDGALDKMAKSMRSGTKGSAKELTSALQELGITVGQELLPVINPLIEDSKKAAKDFAKWARENKPLVRSLGQLLIGVVGVGTVLAPVLLSMSAMVSLTTVLGPGIKTMGGSMFGLSAGALAVGIAFIELGTHMGKLIQDQDTLNTLQREGISLQLGLSKLRGVSLKSDLSAEENASLEGFADKKERLAKELQDVSTTGVALFGDDQKLFGLDVGFKGRGEEDIRSDIAEADANIDALNQVGLKRGKARKATESAEHIGSFFGAAPAPNAAQPAITSEDSSRAIEEARAAIDALQTDRARSTVEGSVHVSVTDDRVSVTKESTGTIPLQLDSGPVLE